MILLNEQLGITTQVIGNPKGQQLKHISYNISYNVKLFAQRNMMFTSSLLRTELSIFGQLKVITFENSNHKRKFGWYSVPTTPKLKANQGKHMTSSLYGSLFYPIYSSINSSLYRNHFYQLEHHDLKKILNRDLQWLSWWIR